MPSPRPSEWGKINAGQPYGVLSVDLGRAIFGVPWGKYQLPLVYFAIEHSWGIARTKRRGDRWPDPEPFALNVNALATEWNMPRQRLYEARDWLIAANFLLKDTDGFWVNKDAHAWVNPDSGEPLLAPPMMMYAARARGRTEKPDKETSVTPESDTVSRPSVTCTPDSESACNGPALHDVTVQRDTVSRPSVTPRARALEERAELDSEISRFASLAAPGAAGMFDDERLDAAHAGCVEAARVLFGDDKAKTVQARGMDINDKVLGRFDCYEAALREVDRRVKAGTVVRNFHTLALAIAQEYRLRGIPGDSNEIRPAAVGEKSDRPAGPGLLERIKAREAKHGR